MHSVQTAVNQLVESTKQDIHYTHILSLLSSLERLDKVTSESISSLLEVVCSIRRGHYQNGGKQRNVILDINLPAIPLQSDGTISSKYSDFPYLLREDKSFDEKNWENDDTDAYKLLLTMKRDLRDKIYCDTFVTKEDKLRYSKILGLNFLKNSAHLFLLELGLVEENQQIIPYYYLSHKSYGTKHPDELICMWLAILNFSVKHVPNRRFTKNFLPTKENVDFSNVTPEIDLTN